MSRAQRCWNRRYMPRTGRLSLVQPGRRLALFPKSPSGPAISTWDARAIFSCYLPPLYGAVTGDALIRMRFTPEQLIHLPIRDNPNSGMITVPTTRVNRFRTLPRLFFKMRASLCGMSPFRHPNTLASAEVNPMLSTHGAVALANGKPLHPARDAKKGDFCGPSSLHQLARRLEHVYAC